MLNPTHDNEVSKNEFLKLAKEKVFKPSKKRARIFKSKNRYEIKNS